MWESLGAVVPSLGVLVLFVIVIRAFILGDRRERARRAEEDRAFEAELAAIRAKNPEPPPVDAE